MFDKLMLMTAGKVIYFNDAKKAVPYFKSINFECPKLSNPADYFMSIMSIESIEKPDHDPDDSDGISKSGIWIQDHYNERIGQFDLSYQQSDLRRDFSSGMNLYPEIKDDERVRKTSWCYEYALLAKRNILN